MHRVFASGSEASSEAMKAWSLISQREFYDGTLECESGELAGVVFNKALQFPISITHLTSHTCLTYRRTAQHIRVNRVGFRVIWFVKRGALRISRATGVSVIKAGEAGIVDSNVPFSATAQGDDDCVHESIQAIVPPDLFLRHLEEADKYTAAFSLHTQEGRIVTRLLDILIDDGERLSRPAAKPLVDSLLETIADIVRSQGIPAPRRQSLVDRRLADIENYIMMNLTDPDLCYDKVAASCRISPRYLCYVLKANNTSFSELLWKNRLPKARDWLVAASTRDYPIHEIAYMSGFKSAAHFSRMFKATYQCSPSEYRAANLDRDAEMQEGPAVTRLRWFGELESGRRAMCLQE